MTNLFNHQQQAIDFIIHNGGKGALFHEIGLGKTRTALEIYKAMKSRDHSLKLFVVCPLSLIEAAWGEDILRWTNFVYMNFRNSSVHYKGTGNSKEPKDIDIFITNYESMLTKKFDVFIKIIRQCNFMIVLDESSRLKNHKAQITKKLLSIKHLFKYRLIMSGTPAPNGEWEYWAQMNFIRSGIFHEKYFPFRNHYFHLERKGGLEHFQGQIVTRDMARKMFSQGWKYGITTKRKAELMQRILPFCHHAKKKDCLDLPDQIDEIRKVDMPPKLRQYYEGMKKDLIIEIKNNYVTAQTALTKIMKLRQITSGFAIDEGSKAQNLGVNPKLKELRDLLEEAGDQQVIIWCQFHYEIEVIENTLEGIYPGKVCTLYGKTKDKDWPIVAFKGGSAKYLIAHPRSAGHGLTFTNCSLQVFYSLDYSWEAYEQARGRIHRVGQVNKCTYVHLVASDSIDERILDVLRHKKEATEIMYKMVYVNGGKNEN